MITRTDLTHLFSAILTLFLLNSLFFNKLFASEENNGFDLDNTLIPRNEIYHGGPPRDGIPSIDTPEFVEVKQAKFLDKNDRILGIDRHGIHKAYPIRILNHHEIVNDHFGEEAIVITYCPLCGTGMAFKATVYSKMLTFGVSGLLYNSDVLLYDRQTESLWSQIMSQAISGPLKGEKLRQITLTHTTWADWSERYPDSLVLSADTGFQRDYTRSPYSGYEEDPSLYFQVSHLDRRYHPKELVIGLTIGDQHKAYPFKELSKLETAFIDTFAGQAYRIEFDAVNRTGKIIDTNNREIPTTIAYWFAWMAFYPQSEVFIASQ